MDKRGEKKWTQAMAEVKLPVEYGYVEKTELPRLFSAHPYNKIGHFASYPCMHLAVSRTIVMQRSICYE